MGFCESLYLTPNNIKWKICLIHWVLTLEDVLHLAKQSSNWSDTALDTKFSCAGSRVIMDSNNVLWKNKYHHKIDITSEKHDDYDQKM